MFNDKSVLIANSFSLEKFQEFASCKICKGILIEPVRCINCNQFFCKKCADKTLATSTACPSGCQKFSYVPSKQMENLLSFLKFKCVNDCGKEIPYKEFNNHYNFDCDKVDFKAKFEVEENKRTEEMEKIEELKKAISEKINILKPEGLPDYNEDKIPKLFVSKYHLHPLERDLYRGSIPCSVCGKYLERNYEKFTCEKCRFAYCIDCKNEELKENNK